MGVHNFRNVRRVLRLGEAFIVDHHIVLPGPIGIVVQFGLKVPGLSSFLDDGPLYRRVLRDARGEGLLLEVVVVAASSGNKKRVDGGVFTRL